MSTGLDPWPARVDAEPPPDAPLPAPPACTNCGAALHGPYCSGCGQEARAPLPPLRRFLAEELGGVLDVDGRIPRTLRLLLRPGTLTVAYLAGRRVPFVAPLRLALSSSLLLFLALAWRSPGAGEPALAVGSSLAADVGAVAGGHADRLAIALLLLLPIVALLLRLVDGRRHPFLAHLVFALHVHAFASLAALAATVASLARVGRHPLGVALLAAVGVTAAYLLVAMRRVYRRGWPRTVLAWAFVGGAQLVLCAAAFLAVVLSVMDWGPR